MRTAQKYIFLLIAFLLGLFGLRRIYYFAGYFVNDYGSLDLTTYRTAAIQAISDPGGVYGHGFIYPPFATIIFYPLTLFSEAGAKRLYQVLTALAVYFLLYALIRWLKHPWPALLALGGFVISFAFWSTNGAFFLGQIDLILAFLMFLDLFGIVPKKYRGILLGFVAAIKLSPAFYGIIFLFRKDWGSAIRAVLSGIFWTILTFIFKFELSTTFWFGGHMGDVHKVNDLPYGRNQSLSSLLVRLHANEQFIDHIGNIIWLIVLLTAFVGVFFWLKLGRDYLAILTMVLGMLLGFPISNIHNWAPIILIVPLLLASKDLFERVISAILAIVLTIGMTCDHLELRERSITLGVPIGSPMWLWVNCVVITSLIIFLILVVRSVVAYRRHNTATV